MIGSAISAPVTGLGRSLEEILYDVAQTALRDADLAIEDIDGIVVAANDQLDGRAISVMMASGSVGGVERDILSTPSAGEHAFVMGVLRVASGQYETQLVLAWSPTEAHPMPEAERLAADPYFHRRLPLDELSAFALQASALRSKVPEAQAVAEALAGGKPDGEGCARWPITAAMTSPAVTGAVALVLASEDFVAARGGTRPAWVRGMGWATEPGFLGDRDLSRAPALEAAAEHAYAEAGITDPAAMFDVAEVSDPTPYQQLIALDGLGLSRPAQWSRDVGQGKIRLGGKVPVNPSGGFLATNPVYCAGLIRITEAANQVRGSAGIHQVAGAKTALGHAASGFAMQYQTVVVLGQSQ